MKRRTRRSHIAGPNLKPQIHVHAGNVGGAQIGAVHQADAVHQPDRRHQAAVDALHDALLLLLGEAKVVGRGAVRGVVRLGLDFGMVFLVRGVGGRLFGDGFGGHGGRLVVLSSSRVVRPAGRGTWTGQKGERHKGIGGYNMLDAIRCARRCMPWSSPDPGWLVSDELIGRVWLDGQETTSYSPLYIHLHVTPGPSTFLVGEEMMGMGYLEPGGGEGRSLVVPLPPPRPVKIRAGLANGRPAVSVHEQARPTMGVCRGPDSFPRSWPSPPSPPPGTCSPAWGSERRAKTCGERQGKGGLYGCNDTPPPCRLSPVSISSIYALTF